MGLLTGVVPLQTVLRFNQSELEDHMRLVTAVAIIAGVRTPIQVSGADGTVSTYLRDGWEIKAASQISSTGHTQIILQRGPQGVVCTIYYSVKDNGWIPQGCDPLP
jgi:hypothetical protein